MNRTTIEVNTSVEGESVELKLERAIHNREPIDNTIGAKAYNERKDGVIASRNQRTDRFEVAASASEKVANIKKEGYVAKAKKRHDEEQAARDKAAGIVNDESTQGE